MSYMQPVVLYAFLYGNRLTLRAAFSGSSHTGTGAPVQHPFWGGVSSISRREAPSFYAITLVHFEPPWIYCLNLS
jgi:hypothetical protein